MSILGVEPVVAGLAKKLTDGLPAAIAAINATVTDGATIDLPAQVLDHIPSLESLVVFPTVGVGHGPGELTDDTGHEATGIYRLAVVCVVQNADLQTLVRQVRRYVLACTRVTLEGRNVAHATVAGVNAAYGVRLTRLDYGDALRESIQARDDGPPQSLISPGGLVIEALTDEI